MYDSKRANASGTNSVEIVLNQNNKRPISNSNNHNNNYQANLAVKLFNKSDILFNSIQFINIIDCYFNVHSTYIEPYKPSAERSIYNCYPCNY